MQVKDDEVRVVQCVCSFEQLCDRPALTGSSAPQQCGMALEEAVTVGDG